MTTMDLDLELPSADVALEAPTRLPNDAYLRFIEESRAALIEADRMFDCMRRRSAPTAAMFSLD